MSGYGHVYICDDCARRVGLRETFLMLIYERPCEGCGRSIGHRSEVREVETTDGVMMKMHVPVGEVARCWQMWRVKMWPVALGIALQDFAGAHAHDWNWNYCNYQTGERRESCRCGEKRTRHEAPSVPATP